jgi:hypothetical protein
MVEEEELQSAQQEAKTRPYSAVPAGLIRQEAEEDEEPEPAPPPKRGALSRREEPRRAELPPLVPPPPPPVVIELIQPAPSEQRTNCFAGEIATERWMRN